MNSSVWFWNLMFCLLDWTRLRPPELIAAIREYAHNSTRWVSEATLHFCDINYSLPDKHKCSPDWAQTCLFTATKIPAAAFVSTENWGRMSHFNSHISKQAAPVGVIFWGKGENASGVLIITTDNFTVWHCDDVLILRTCCLREHTGYEVWVKMTTLLTFVVMVIIINTHTKNENEQQCSVLKCNVLFTRLFNFHLNSYHH